MTSVAGDAKDLKSWEEAFNCPIATTRQIEKQLRNDIAANKERLRTLVGASYRDLLGTADRIIHLDEQMQETEKLLGDVSLQCNLNVIDKKARQLAELQEQAADQKSPRRQLIAQLSLLQSCQKCVPRIFRHNGSILTAAKVVAVSRLLIKRIGQEDEVPPLLESSRAQLASQRRRLLKKVDLTFISSKSSLQQLVEAVCAFCIVTSSSSSDAIRHFHDVRLDEIRRLSSALERGLGYEDVLSAFNYYLQSLRMTTQLWGRQFSDAMRELRSRPILRSPDLQSLEEIDLARVQQFIPGEILSFVPWIKHQDVQKVEAPSVLEKWSEGAFREVSLGLKRAVDSLPDTPKLLEFRARLLQIWLPVSFSSPTHFNAGIFVELRTVLNTRMKELLHLKAESLSAIASEIETGLETDDSRTLVSSQHVWDHDFVTAPLGKGASSYKKALTDRHYGQSKIISAVLTSLQRWTASIVQSQEGIQQLRGTRWIDFIEEDENGDDEADRIEKIEKTLQMHDPAMYEQELKSSLGTATTQFQNKIKEAGERLDKTDARNAIFLLRTIRGIYQHLATSFLQQQQQQDLKILSSAIPHLHRLLAATTTITLLDSLKPTSFVVQKRKITSLTNIWEGDPPIPTHPTPHILKLLQRLTAIMADQGPDLWSPDAADAVKRAIRRGLMDRKLLPLASTRSLTQTNGTEREDKLINGTTNADPDIQAQVAIQALFDLLYLSHAMTIDGDELNNPHDNQSDSNTIGNEDQSASQPPQTFTSLIQQRKESVSPHPLDAAALAILEDRASDYWTKTSLLFGLLA